MKSHEPIIKENRWSKELEMPIFEKWQKDKAYKFNKNTKKKIYSIDTPPPYINTPVHIGQATTYVLMDMFARFKRMTGYEVLFPLGLDKNGLPIEIAAEKRFNIRLTETPRKEFIGYCTKILDEAGTATTESFLRLGISFNSYDPGEGIGDVYETDSEAYRALTQATFIDLWHKGLIYEDERITNWDPELQTTIADSEIEYKDIKSHFNDVKFKVKGTDESIVIGTTRPELICTCGAVAYNPNDKRYKHLNGKTAITPLFSKEVPIISHNIADASKGTGLVMMCSAGDLSDIRFFREMKLEPVIAIEKDGTMNHHAGFLRGLTVREARKRIIEELKAGGLLVKQTETVHRTPLSERSGAEIEFISMKEFYLKQIEYKAKMREFANKINFYAPESRQILLDWIDSVSIDWPISRRRYYATEIPLWYCKDCSHVIVPKKGRYYRPWMESPDIKHCPQCRSQHFVGETRVLDTWFDSSISALYILMYERNNKFFKKAFPCSLRPNGKEILRTWTYYAILRAYQLTGRCIFKDQWVNYHIVDEKGYKMSKSKGNVIDTKEVLDKFGAEQFRLWAAIEGNLDKTDFRCSFERIEGAGKTITKLLNVARFISMFPNAKKPSALLALDVWIINEVNDILKKTAAGYLQYDFHNPATAIKHFIWETFASHYLELVKPRAYNQENKFTSQEQDSAFYTIHYCLDRVLKMLAPVNPMIAHYIYKALMNKDIHSEAFPKAEKSGKVSFNTEDITILNTNVWKFKKDNKLSLKDSINELAIDRKFKSIGKDLTAAHNARNVVYDKFCIKL